MIKGVVFDMDGTIADSEKLAWNATRDYMAKKGIFLTEEEKKSLSGLIWKESIRRILEKRGYEYSQSIKNAIKEKYVRNLKKEVEPIPHIYEFLANVKKNFKVGLATNSRFREVEIIFNKLGFDEYFDIKIARNHVKNVKPHPEIYYKAADSLGLKPDECIAFEDTVVGITAAKGAGLACIAITNTHPALELKKADMIIKTYKEISIEKIMSLG